MPLQRRKDNFLSSDEVPGPLRSSAQGQRRCGILLVPAAGSFPGSPLGPTRPPPPWPSSLEHSTPAAKTRGPVDRPPRRRLARADSVRTLAGTRTLARWVPAGSALQPGVGQPTVLVRALACLPCMYYLLDLNSCQPPGPSFQSSRPHPCLQKTDRHAPRPDTTLPSTGHTPKALRRTSTNTEAIGSASAPSSSSLRFPARTVNSASQMVMVRG